MAEDRQSDNLEHRIAAARAAEDARTAGIVTPGMPKGYNQGSRVLATLLGALVGGGVIGWAVDHWLHTSPWGLLIILALAIVGAFRQIMQISKERAE